MYTTAGIILAGGRSKRMGQEKALLSLPGETMTFTERLSALMTSLCKEVILVLRDIDQVAAETPPNVRIVTDHIPDVGPLMGLYSGLSAMESTHALVVAVDMPYVQPEVAAFLCSQPLGEALIVPLVQQVAQVLLAVYPRSVLPVIEKQLRAGRRDPRSLLEVAPVCYIEEAQLRAIDPQLRSFVNINTPEELAKRLLH